MEKNEDRLVSGFYVDGVEEVKANFAQWQNQKIIIGSVPRRSIRLTPQVAYLALDMNCAPPEGCAAPFLAATGPRWGGSDGRLRIHGLRRAGCGLRCLGAGTGIPILALPTGQGLIINRPRTASSGATNCTVGKQSVVPAGIEPATFRVKWTLFHRATGPVGRPPRWRIRRRGD